MTAEQVKTWVQTEGMQAPVIVVGSQEAADAWSAQAARLAVCTQGTGCGTCIACKQATAWQHPDTIYLQDDDDLITEKTISIKAIRALLERMAQTSFSGRKVVVIPRAERLPGDATNALLKTLEELSATTRLIVTTNFPNRLLPTLRSRSQIVRLKHEQPGAVSEGSLAAILEEHKKGGLTEEELETVSAHLEESLRQNQNEPGLVRSFLRLRDYYKIQSSRGNVSLAADVLVASLLSLRNTASK